MTLPRFSVRELLGLVTFLAVGTTALLYASAGWTIVACSAAIAFLMVGTLGAWNAQGERRAFWRGVAVFGWVFLFLNDWWPSKIQSAVQPLPTRQLLRIAWEDGLPYLRHAPTYELDMGASAGGVSSSTITQHPPLGMPVQFVPGSSYPNPRDFLRIGQALWALVIAYLGGRLGRYFYVTRSRDNEQTEN